TFHPFAVPGDRRRPRHRGRGRQGVTLFRLLHAVGSAVPGGFPHATAFGNRVLRPLFEALHDERRFRIEVWDGLAFDVDPRDTIGGNLAFAPRAFEYHERRFLARHL